MKFEQRWQTYMGLIFYYGQFDKELYSRWEKHRELGKNIAILYDKTYDALLS